MRLRKSRKVDSRPGMAEGETLDLDQIRAQLLAREPRKQPTETWPSAAIRTGLHAVAATVVKTRVELGLGASAMIAILTRTALIAASGATTMIMRAARSTSAIVSRMSVAAREFAESLDTRAVTSLAIATIVWAARSGSKLLLAVARACSRLLRALFFATRRFAERIEIPVPPAPPATVSALQEMPVDDALVRHDLEIHLARSRLAARETARGFNDPDVASELHLLGALEHEAGRFNEALALYSTALVIRQRTLGRDHPEVAATLADVEAARRDEADSAAEANVASR